MHGAEPVGGKHFDMTINMNVACSAVNSGETFSSSWSGNVLAAAIPPAATERAPRARRSRDDSIFVMG
jgi:hypothetical protein